MNEEKDKSQTSSQESQQETEVTNGHNYYENESPETEETGQQEAGAEQDLYAGMEEEELRNALAEKDELIEKLTAELQEQKDTALRKSAELDNVKKRSQRERQQHSENAKIEALEKILPLREDLQRSLQAAKNVDVDDKFLEGVQLVADKFEAILDDYGVEAIEEEMVPFNVDIHDAMLRQPAGDENVESNTVIKVMEPGYKIGSRVIKHAKVIVSE